MTVITVALSKYDLLLLIKAMTTAQFPKEDEKTAFALANRLKELAQ